MTTENALPPFKSIKELRRRVLTKANEYINVLNKLNEIIFGNSSKNKYSIIENKNDISLRYIKENIDICNSMKDEIKSKTNYIKMIKDKNKECYDKLKKRRDA